MPIQLSLLKKPSNRHGGDLNRGKRKTFRPLDPKRPIHVTLKSSRAKNAWSLLHPENEARVEALLLKLSRKWRVRLLRHANVGNHLHLLAKAETREGFQHFLRELSGRVAMLVTRVKKGASQGKFWDSLAFTRVVNWGRDLANLDNYIVTNLFEAAGLVSARDKRAGARAAPGFG